ncbi:DUF4145 domain-containing protein [Leptospira neocaledonica]|uniref:DUF4145 domain-containing protein n=1 Tax=Leptospira neocaledonica TaxID=2023192 RepID=A0A2M9ZT89_9LEPT|nr:DUF4145 domain-containing protein [Leptospira neocaledonica]PJZ75312.1 hypothetical protein CH365_19515 [Leptospira neocaledonica]
MTNLNPQLELPRCPHCQVARPNLSSVFHFESRDHAGADLRRWRVYNCTSCGGLTTAYALNFNQTVIDSFPKSMMVDDDIPERPRHFLQQALDSLHAPSGSIMLSASCVDSMLKMKGYNEGNLYSRIDKAAQNHLITNDMAAWAHEVRLDANDQRHADENASLPTIEDAKRVIDFVISFGQYLFVLPAKIQRGLKHN